MNFNDTQLHQILKGLKRRWNLTDTTEVDDKSLFSFRGEKLTSFSSFATFLKFNLTTRCREAARKPSIMFNS